MRLSFITATYNGLDYTRAFLDSFAATVPPGNWEYILVDDGSRDGTRDFLATLQPPFKVMLNESNGGFAYSNNRGAAAATGDTLVFLNNDLILSPGWLEPMLEAFQRFEQLGAVGNIQLNARSGLVDHAGIFFDLTGRPAHARKNRRRRPQEEYTFWNAVTAACFAMPRPLFQQLGGFDEGFVNGSEDVDLCVRIRQASHSIVVANQSIIRHHVSVSPGRHDKNAQNTARLLSKWQPVMAEWGKREWPREYLARYARQWWRFNFSKFCKALWLLPRSR